MKSSFSNKQFQSEKVKKYRNVNIIFMSVYFLRNMHAKIHVTLVYLIFENVDSNTDKIRDIIDSTCLLLRK